MDALAPELMIQVAAWDTRGWPRPDVVLVTGSALDVDLGETLIEPLPLASLLPFPIRAIAGHRLSVELVRAGDDRVVLYFRGRIHCYQGFEPAEVVFPVRLGALLGARVAILTNAAGSLDLEMPPGTIAALADHLSLGGGSPLRGEPPAEWGERFPPLNDAYDPRLRALARRVAAEQGFALREGVYAWLLGPSYETPSRDPHAGPRRRHAGRHVDGAGGDRAAPPRRRLRGVLAGHQPGRRPRPTACRRTRR